MARKIRIENASFHHILNHGVKGRAIFWYHTSFSKQTPIFKKIASIRLYM